jgi:protein CpxP
MQSRTLSIFCGLALASAITMAQSANPAPAQTGSPNQQSDQQVGVSPQTAPDNAAEAQNRPASPQRAAKFLAQQLGLSPAQEAQIVPIIADRQQQIEALSADQTIAPRDRRARVQGIMQDSRTRIETLLTDSQKQQFEQMVADRRVRRQQQGQQQAQPQAPPEPQAPPQPQ